MSSDDISTRTSSNTPTPERGAREVTPMLAQYLDIKSKYPDAILFYRMGDFYEMFFEDAVTASPVLEVQLTARDKNAASPIPMCGVPYHSVALYLQKMLSHGFKVAICDQVEDSAVAKGLVKREVTRVVTPALIGDPDLVPEQTRCFLIGLHEIEGVGIEVAVLDLLGSSLRMGTLAATAQIADLFREYQPKELLVGDTLRQAVWLSDLTRLYPGLLVTCREAYFREGGESVTYRALQAYLRETQKLESLPTVTAADPLFSARTVTLDPTTVESLELVRSHAGQGKTLFDVLDRTQTPMGRRALREWLTHPSSDLDEIESRQGAVADLVARPDRAAGLCEWLAPIRDLERLSTKTSLGLAMPRDLVAIRETLLRLPGLAERLHACDSPKLRQLGEALQLLPELTAQLQAALEDIAPATLRDGGIFRETYRPEIAELRHLSSDAKSTIAAMEAREKNRTGIPSLKIKHSKVFGYTIEITRAHVARVPEDYVRKQTIANGERYITAELKRFEEKVITAEHKLRSLEEALFLELRQTVAAQATALLADARLLAELDVLCSFGRVAREQGYQRPVFNRDGILDIEEGRHPVIETLLAPGTFVPNSIRFAPGDCRTWIVTGPNMAGKSTIMRQVALLALMAQCGSFVPAVSAQLPVLDAIFTRIGSSDDLTRGRSTFMVEMTEVCRIVQRATERSLILIDEIGRGTSTYDGLSIAWSLLEYIHTEVRAMTLFATHFHEVTGLARIFPDLKNANVLVEKWRDSIVFLHRLAPGICNQSYGIEVARLAGLPDKLLDRAREILTKLESQSQRASRARSQLMEKFENQLAFFEDREPLERPSGLET